MRIAVALLAAAVAVLVGMLVLRKDPPPPEAPPAPTFVSPLAQVESGETLRIAQGPKEFRYVVLSTTHSEVEVRVMEYQNGAPPAGSEPRVERWKRNGLGIPPDAVVQHVAPDAIEVHGRFWPCWRVRALRDSGPVFYWLTDALPVHGLLRLARAKDGAPDLATAYVALPDQAGEPDPPR